MFDIWFKVAVTAIVVFLFTMKYYNNVRRVTPPRMTTTELKVVGTINIISMWTAIACSITWLWRLV
jgi:hypothetical protein